MSLLYDAPDEVLVYVEEDGADGDGNPIKVPVAYPAKVRGRVQPDYSLESNFNGQEVATVYRLVCRTFPAGAYAKVEWGGRTWDVLGEPMRRNGSSGIAHVTVILRARRPEVRYG